MIMIKADIETEVLPVAGSEKQSEELVKYLLSEFEQDLKSIGESNIFGTIHVAIYEKTTLGRSICIVLKFVKHKFLLWYHTYERLRCNIFSFFIDKSIQKSHFTKMWNGFYSLINYVYYILFLLNCVSICCCGSAFRLIVGQRLFTVFSPWR